MAQNIRVVEGELTVMVPVKVSFTARVEMNGSGSLRNVLNSTAAGLRTTAEVQFIREEILEIGGLDADEISAAVAECRESGFDLNSFEEVS